jgi:ribosome recycling factor
MFDLKEFETKCNNAIEHFDEELKKIRTGRAHPSMLDSVRVEVYGTMMPLNQIANVTAAEAQMLQLTPFDPSNIQAIAGAIRADQSLGLNPSDDGRVIRVPIPALTEERRKALVRQANDKVEEARIALRNIRQDVLKDVKRAKDAKEISEDDQKRIEKSIDTDMSNYNSKLDSIFALKEKDILTI